MLCRDDGDVGNDNDGCADSANFICADGVECGLIGTYGQYASDNGGSGDHDASLLKIFQRREREAS